MRRTPHGGVIKGDAEVSELAVLRNSVALAHATITGGDIADSTISGKIYGSPTIIRSTIAGTVSGHAHIIDTNILPGVEIFDHASLSHVDLHGTVKVYGTAKLQNLVLSYVSTTGDALRIHRGIWEHPPRHCEMKGWTLVECVGDLIHIGCYCRSFPHWLNSRKFASRMGWSDKDFDTAADIFRSWLMLNP